MPETEKCHNYSTDPSTFTADKKQTQQQNAEKSVRPRTILPEDPSKVLNQEPDKPKQSMNFR
jgi:hypothetical protein